MSFEIFLRLYCPALCHLFGCQEPRAKAIQVACASVEPLDVVMSHCFKEFNVKIMYNLYNLFYISNYLT